MTFEWRKVSVTDSIGTTLNPHTKLACHRKKLPTPYHYFGEFAISGIVIAGDVRLITYKDKQLLTL